MSSLIKPQTLREAARWYALKDHPIQHQLVTDKIRFKVVPAGRRSGKTERAKRYIVREAMETPGPYFIAGPSQAQIKRIYWEDLKLLSFSSLLPTKPRESDLIINFANGSTISLIGLDQPSRIEGTFWMGGIVDEFGDTKESAWPENISPALDTYDPRNPDYRAWCWLIGVPEGLNHYYDLYEMAKLEQNTDWKTYHWKSAEILPPDMIEAAKRRMSKKQFLQEYEASFETAGGRIYEDYSDANLTQALIQSHEQILWHHDFNYTPMSSGIGVRRGQAFYILDEIILESAVSRQSAEEFVERYKSHQNKNIVVYGDPAGKAGEKHGHASDYTEIGKVLRDNGWQVTYKVKPKAPAIRDRQNAVRAKICNAADQRSLFVNPHKCPYAHKGLSTVQTKKGSTFLEEDSQYQHITTAIGYCVDMEWPVSNKILTPDHPEPIATLNHYHTSRLR